MLNKNQEELQKIINYRFNDTKALTVALTHKSCITKPNEKDYNGRMEFLGDSILSAIVAEALYLKYPYENEGKLSQLKAQVVSASNLSDWSRKINLGNYVFLGKRESINGARIRDNLLCDVFEAVVGLMYLDGGFENAKKFVLKFLDDQKEIVITDYKSRLQEVVQSIYRKLPKYVILKEIGPDHNKKFEAAVYAEDKFLGGGAGNSKKEAHQSAAKQAMKNIGHSVLCQRKYK